MTLSEIATFAGEKVGKTDSDTVTFLKKSASLNYRRVCTRGNFCFFLNRGLDTQNPSDLRLLLK